MGLDLSEDMSNYYREDYRMKKPEEMQSLVMFVDWKMQFVKVSSLTRLIYKFNNLQ